MLRITAIYSLIMGLLLIGTWVVLLALGQVPELWTRPLETGFLLAAEFLTGIGLILGGYGLLAPRRWGFTVALFSLGMMFYTVVQSIGLFAEQGILPASAWFVLVTALTALVMGYFLRHSPQPHPLA